MSSSTRSPLWRHSERISDWSARVGAVGLASMMFLTLFDVVGRVFDRPIAGSVEMTELVMGMMIYLGIGYTTFLKGHIRVDILITNLPLSVQAILDVITTAIGLGFVGVMVWRLWLQCLSRIGNNDLTQIYEWPVWPSAIVMAIASLMMVVALALHLLENIRVVARGSTA